MSDLVDRPISLAATLANDDAETVQQAADEIQRLQAVVDAARAAAERWHAAWDHQARDCSDAVIRALDGEP